jgi:hypothetical protein
MDIWPPVTLFGFYHVPAVMSVIWIEALVNSSSQQQSLAVVYSETILVWSLGVGHRASAEHQITEPSMDLATHELLR